MDSVRPSPLHDHNSGVPLLVTVYADGFSYDKETESYVITMRNASLIHHDSHTKNISIRVDSKMVHDGAAFTSPSPKETSFVLEDEHFDFLLDQIDEDNRHSEQITNITNITTDTNITDVTDISYVLSENSSFLSNIISEWNDIIAITDNEEYAHCDGSQPCRDCVAIERIKFVLSYYSEWVNSKCDVLQKAISDKKFMLLSPTKDTSESFGNQSVMDSFEWITDFFDQLTDYSMYDLSNDFEHIRQSHMEKDENSICKQAIFEYFEVVFGNCNDLQCHAFRRSRRDKHIDNVVEEKRREEFFIKTQQTFVNDDRVQNEIYLQSLLDKMHVCLLHKHSHKLYISNSYKFITKTKATHDNEVKENGNDDGEQAPLHRLDKHTFGSSITYWDESHHRYCQSVYADLRTELLNNTIYSLSAEMYQSLKVEAGHFLRTEVGENMVALREHDWMKRFRILKGSQITLDHVIAVLCYVNIPYLQRAYKRNGFIRSGKTRKELLEKHCQIWHFSRLLLEGVHCYGKPLDIDKKYYHIFDSKLIFDRYHTLIDLPISLTTQKEICYGFSDTTGMSVEFAHGGLSDLQSLSLDLSLFSQFPLEEEVLIFHSFVSIKDIIIERLHHDQWINILQFWHKVTEGFFFSHLIESDIVSRNDQLCICAMIQNMMIMKGCSDDSMAYDDRIPEYMQILFNVLCKGYFWRISSEYKLLIPKLNKYLTGAHAAFYQCLKLNENCCIRNASTFEWHVQHEEQKLLHSITHPWIKSPKYNVYINDNCSLLFHFEVQNKANNNLFRCRVHLDDKPDHIKCVNFGIGLFCKEIKYDNYSYGQMSEERLFNLSLHSLFETKLLKPFKNGFVLKLQMQMFYIRDEFGHRLDISPKSPTTK